MGTRKLILLGVAFLGLGCGSDQAFHVLGDDDTEESFGMDVQQSPSPLGGTEQSSGADAAAMSEDPETLKWEESTVESAHGGADQVWTETSTGLVREQFGVGANVSTHVADYLFVVDNSVSMGSLLELVRSGFASIGDGEVFPKKTRIAVMNTLPANPDREKRLHPAVKHSVGLARSPGFMGFVDGPRIAKFRKMASPEMAERFSEDGCSPWFRPTQTNENGVSCLVAHTQVELAPTAVEAGLTAFGQFLAANTGTATFRTGAAINVIFVSDTHDPGMKLEAVKAEKRAAVEALIEDRPTYADLLELVELDHEPASFRLHAIAPMGKEATDLAEGNHQTPCGEAWFGIEPSYFNAAMDSGGVMADICEIEDYGPIIERIARDGAVMANPVFSLGHSTASVQSVTVNGERVAWAPTADGRGLVLDGDLENMSGSLEVVYRPGERTKSDKAAPMGALGR